MLVFADVIEAISGIRPVQATQLMTEVVVDVNQVISSSLYFSITGETHDGHEDVAESFRRGALLAVVEREIPLPVRMINLTEAQEIEKLGTEDLPLALLVEDSLTALYQLATYWKGKVDPRVICITGSVGKTTTKDLVCEMLENRFRTVKSSGKPDSLTEAPLGFLSLMKNHQVFVLEVELDSLGTNPDFDKLVVPDVAIMTNISTVHAAKTDSRKIIADKAAWLNQIPTEGSIILNYDDPWIRAMATQTHANVFFYGLNPAADLWADDVQGLGLDGIHFRMHYGKDVMHLRVPLIGRHSVHTALRAAATGIVEGLSWQEIVQGLRSGNTQLRLVAVRSSHGALVLDDTYNTSPESVLAAINLLAELEGRKIVVLGGIPGLGQFERQGHEMVGLRASQVADLLITVGDLGEQIASAARSSWMPASSIITLESDKDVISYLQEHLESTDVVLVKGSHDLNMNTIAASLESV